MRCGIQIEGTIGRREGSVVLELEPRWTPAFHHVLYVPRLRENVLSVSSLEDQAYTIEFRGHSIQFMSKGSYVCGLHHTRDQRGMIVQSMGSTSS